MKRFLSILLTLTMLMGLGLVAYAADRSAAVTFVANVGNNAPAETTVTIPEGQTSADYQIPAIVPTHDSMGFNGWKSSSDNNVYFPGQTLKVTGDTTLTAQWETFQITVDNTAGQNVSIEGKEFTAYKLFDASYGTADEDTDPVVVDDAPHAYYLSKSSPFYDGIAGVKDAEGNDGPATDGAIITILKDYFDLTELPGDSSKVLVTPKKVGGVVQEFDEADAYELAQKLQPHLAAVTNTAYKFTANGSDEEKAVINTSQGGPGYYLVAGTGTSADGKTVTATVALTTTDPKATIKAKLAGNKVEKEITEGEGVSENTAAVGDVIPYKVSTSVPDMTGYEHYYFILNDTMSKGLTFNNDIEITVTLEDDDGYVEQLTSTRNGTIPNVTYTITNGGTYYKLSDGTYTTTAPVPTTEKTTPDDFADEYEVRNHEYVMYKSLTTDLGYTKVEGEDKYTKTLTLNTDYTVTETAQTDKSTDVEIVFKDFYNKFNGLTGADIEIAYTATINGDAAIGTTPNKNSAVLTYSNNPNVNPQGDPFNPDKPNPDTEVGENGITGVTPEAETKTYVTGIKLKKVDGSDNTKTLAGAKFEFEGWALNELVETDSEYFREIADGETGGTHYLLKDGTYTDAPPTIDTITVDASVTPVKRTLNKGTWRDYVQDDGWTITTTNDGDFGEVCTEAITSTPKYILDTVKTWNLNVATANQHKLTVETDEEGIITITGLNQGAYKLTETAAPNGYNGLAAPIYIYVYPTFNETTKAFESWEIYEITKELYDQYTAPVTDATTGDELSPVSLLTAEDLTGCTQITADTEGTAWLSELKIENNSGTELPSTGGIGTTIFYVVGGLLAVGAGVVLVTKKRMGKIED